MPTLGPRATNAFRLPVQEFVGDNADEGTTHQGAALAGADKLFAWDCGHKFEQAAVEVGIAFLPRQV